MRIDGSLRGDNVRTTTLWRQVSGPGVRGLFDLRKNCERSLMAGGRPFMRFDVRAHESQCAVLKGWESSFLSLPDENIRPTAPLSIVSTL